MDGCDHNCMKEKHYIKSFEACFPFLEEFSKNNTFNLTTIPGKTEPSPMLSVTLIKAGLLIIFIASTNLLLIIGIVKTNKKLSLVNKLYILWSAFDLFRLAPTSYLLSILIEMQKSVSIKLACDHYVYHIVLFSIFGGMNTGTFILISVLRHLSITKPLMEVKMRNVLVALLAIFIVYVVPNFILTFAAYSPKYNSYKMLLANWIFIAVVLYLAVILLLFFNTYSQIILSQKARTIWHATQEAQNRIQERAVKTLILISCVYVICYITTANYYIFIITKLIAVKQNPSAFVMIQRHFTFLNAPMSICSGMNGIAYIAKNVKIKRYYSNLLKRNKIHVENDNS